MREVAGQPACAEAAGWTVGPQMSGSQGCLPNLAMLRAQKSKGNDRGHLSASWGFQSFAWTHGAGPAFLFFSCQAIYGLSLALWHAECPACGWSGCHLVPQFHLIQALVCTVW